MKLPLVQFTPIRHQQYNFLIDNYFHSLKTLNDFELLLSLYIYNVIVLVNSFGHRQSFIFSDNNIDGLYA